MGARYHCQGAVSNGRAGALLLAGPGCRKKDQERGAGASAEEAAAFHEPILEKLTAAGLKPAGFEKAAARPYKAGACFRGEVDKLEVLICQYKDGGVAKQNQKTMETFLAGAMSGATRLQAAVALAVADRHKVDIKGKKINKLLAAFTDQK